MKRPAQVITSGLLAMTIIVGSIGRAAAAVNPLTAECVVQAADTFGHPRLALILILAQERGRVGECSPPNRNGTVDCGPAQINSGEIARLAPRLRMSPPEAFARIRDDGCFNVFVSAYILAEKRQDANGDIWDAMGRYNSATTGIKERYQRGLIEQYQRLLRRMR